MSDPNAMPLFLHRLAERPVMFDGAMGTMIYQHGVFVNACYDELCLTRAELIQSIHSAYATAGADVIETNTFGANRIKLAGYGLVDQVEAINRAGVALARAAAGDHGMVAGAVGPCTLPGQALDDIDPAALQQAFTQQITALTAAGVDLLLLETFEHLAELTCAAAVARQTGVPVVASFTVRQRRHTPAADEPAALALARALDACDDVDAIGVNCSVGPAGMLELLRTVIPAVTKPVIAMPNAGGPSEVGGRILYFNSPEYFTEYAKRYIELGARGVGGCCGTTPDDIRVAARAIRGLSGVRAHLTIAAPPRDSDAAHITPVPTAEKSAFAAKLAAGEPVTSIEMLPPRRIDGLPHFVEQARQCREAGIDAINIPDGPRASARLSVITAAIVLQRDAGIEAIPHYCCRDRNLIGMQADLMGGISQGLHNWLLITGDPPKLGDYPDATGVFDVDAIGLCRLCSNLNCGVDAVGHPIGPAAGMLLGVGADPTAVDINREVDRFAAKIDAGAEYAISQPVFDADALLRFMERVSKSARMIPMLAGVYPLISLRNAQFMNDHVPGVVVPEPVLARMATCETREEGIRMGIDIARELCDRVRGAVQGIQVSAPLGKLQIALDVLA